jgi:hypothetical protein
MAFGSSPALRDPAHQAAKGGRDSNELMSERSPIASRQDDPSGPFNSFRVQAKPPAGWRTAGDFFCVSFFLIAQKNETERRRFPLSLVPIFGLTQKPAKKVKACRRSAERPVRSAEILQTRPF